jgi:hypothetical protein
VFPLDDVLADDLEVVGFNGAPQVECGRALPVARRKSNRTYCVLETGKDGASPSWYEEEEAIAFAKAGRWARLRGPLSWPRSCLSGPESVRSWQPMVVFAAQSLLDEAGRAARPAWFHDELLVWRHLEDSDDSIQAALGPANVVEALLDDWATGLKRRIDAMLQHGHDPAALKRVADFMLCAAKKRPLRWQAYLRFAMAQEPERIRPTFDAFVRHEFPNMAWESYLDEIKVLRETLRSVPVEVPRPVAVSSHATTLSKLHDLTKELPIDVYQSAA